MAVKNWERIKKNNANALLLASYRDAMAENLAWLTGIKSTLECNGMLSFYTNSYEGNLFIYKRVFQVLSDEFHQNSFETIKSESSKLRTYAIFKNSIGTEKYLTDIKNPEIRRIVTKLRLSNHNLMIEIGRHRKIPKELRHCPFCPNLIENEVHFLFQCPVYSIMRNKFLGTVLRNNPRFSFFNMNEKLEYVMTHIDNHVAKYINHCFEIRAFLLAHRMRND